MGLLPSLLIAALFLIVAPVFSQPFHHAKLIGLALAGMLALVSICLRKEIELPPARFMLILMMMGSAVALSLWGSQAPLNSLVEVGFFAAAIAIFFWLCTTDRSAKASLNRTLYGLALFESGLGVLQFFGIPILPQFLLQAEGNRVIGTLGNPEFLATFLATLFLLRFEMASDHRGGGWRMYAGQALIVSALIASQNKGALVFLLAYGAYRFVKRPVVVSSVLVSCLGLILLLFPSACKGRLLLWLASAGTFFNHPVFGVGLGQLGHYNLDCVEQLFNLFPTLRPLLERHTATVLDAHNLLLSMGCETGILGFIGAAAFLLYCVRLLPRMSKPSGAALALLLFKSLYTVVHTSSTGLLLFAILLSTALPLRSHVFTRRSRSVLIGVAALVMLGLGYTIYLVSADYWYQKAMRAIAQARLSTATERIQHALAINPQHSDAHLAYAHICFLRRETTSMSTHIDQAIRLFKTMNSLKISAHMCFYSGLYDDALDLYKEIIQTYPEHLTSLAKIAQIYYLKHHYHQSQLFAARVIAAQPRIANKSDRRNLRIAAELLNMTKPPIMEGRDYGEK